MVVGASGPPSLLHSSHEISRVIDEALTGVTALMLDAPPALAVAGSADPMLALLHRHSQCRGPIGLGRCPVVDAARDPHIGAGGLVMAVVTAHPMTPPQVADSLAGR